MNSAWVLQTNKLLKTKHAQYAPDSRIAVFIFVIHTRTFAFYSSLAVHIARLPSISLHVYCTQEIGRRQRITSCLSVILPRRRDRKVPNHNHGANHRCCCRYAAESSSASKRQSQQGACLTKIEPRSSRHERCRVAVADVAEKVRFHMSFREKLLLAGLISAGSKELLIEFCVIKA